jgi:hypothetical protein
VGTSLKTRLAWLEDRLGTEAEQRRVIIWAGTHFPENSTELRGANLDLHVRVPDREAAPLDCLTPEQRALIRSGDSVVVFEACRNERDRCRETQKPPLERS